MWVKEGLWRDSIVAKLSALENCEEATKLRHCHTVETICRCQACGSHHPFWNRCDLNYCPICAPRLAWKRKKTIEAWAKTVPQPKHVVLTARNRPSFSRIYVQWFKSSFGKLRRSKFASGWRGGLYSLEVTNEGKGWHLHLHALIDADWIDASQLAIIWGQLVTQDYAIVCIKDAREKHYLQEVTKYAVKGSQLASWSAGDILKFIRAFDGVRQFGVFGSLFKDRATRRRILKDLEPPQPECPKCGSTKLHYLSPEEAEIKFGI